MKYEEINELRAHYQGVINAAMSEVARLEKEIQESEAAIKEADVEATDAAKAANDEKYRNARLTASMHRERISAHRAKIANLKNNSLITDGEYQRVKNEFYSLSQRLILEEHKKFCEGLELMREAVEQYERKSRAANSLMRLIHEQVHRPIDTNDPSRMRRDTWRDFRDSSARSVYNALTVSGKYWGEVERMRKSAKRSL